jgi:hypothetical protein
MIERYKRHEYSMPLPDVQPRGSKFDVQLNLEPKSEEANGWLEIRSTISSYFQIYHLTNIMDPDPSEMDMNDSDPSESGCNRTYQDCVRPRSFRRFSGFPISSISVQSYTQWWLSNNFLFRVHSVLVPRLGPRALGQKVGISKQSYKMVRFYFSRQFY